MKKINLDWLTLLFAMFVSVSFVSCSDDDDDKKDKTDDSTASLVGTWRMDYDDEYDDGYVQMTFRANGTGFWEEYDEDDEMVDRISLTYTYNESTKRLKIVYEDGDVEVSTVLSITATTLTLQNSDDDGDTWVDVLYRVR